MEDGIEKRECGFTRAGKYFFYKGFSLLVMARGGEVGDDGVVS